ncbi:long-chain fatty acid transport protein 2-like [Clarias gariepinus]
MFMLFFKKFPYFLHDCAFLIKVLRIKSKRQRLRKRVPLYTVLDCFLEDVSRHPHKPFIIFEDDVYTYLQVDRWSNRAAHTLLKHTHLREGDTAALLVGNEPNFIFLWLGLMKIRCSVSLLNTNIRGKSLMRCFMCCKTKVLIAGAEYRDAVCEMLPELREHGVSVHLLCDNCDMDGIQSLKDKMDDSDDGPVSLRLRAKITMRNPAVYIYTSGTTGLPKAGIVSHDRMFGGIFYQSLFGTNHNDVIYIALPLYHAAGFTIGLGGAIERGITVVLRRKFSVSQFWNDCRKHNVTVIMYIGEILRYLCTTPKVTQNNTLAIKFFLIPFPHALIRYDTETQGPVRDSRGRCVPVPTGETGLLVCKITERTPFQGYAGNPEQTEKKKLRNVFEDGDVYLNTGDLLRTDHQGFIYFQDRVGDTFRWKGENVATTEVSDVISLLDFVEEVCVYGVKVPGHEGRVGMAALRVKEKREFDSNKAFDHVTNFLPVYARPRFIRILRSLDLTGTFKQVKTSLMKEGFDPEKVTPPIYFLQESSKSYIPLTHTHYKSIISGEVRF